MLGVEEDAVVLRRPPGVRVGLLLLLLPGMRPAPGGTDVGRGRGRVQVRLLRRRRITGSGRYRYFYSKPVRPASHFLAS